MTDTTQVGQIPPIPHGSVIFTNEGGVAPQSENAVEVGINFGFPENK